MHGWLFWLDLKGLVKSLVSYFFSSNIKYLEIPKIVIFLLEKSNKSMNYRYLIFYFTQFKKYWSDVFDKSLLKGA